MKQTPLKPVSDKRRAAAERAGSTFTTPSPGPQRHARIKPVSARRARENRERRAMVNRLYPERPRCACGCGRLADDLHEILSRARGGSIVDPGNCVPLARYCHDKATNEDPRFYALGLVIHSWDGAIRGDENLASKNFSDLDAA